MIWTLENIAFLVLIICASCGALMAIVNVVCDIVKMTPWYIKYQEQITRYPVHYKCPECGTEMNFSSFIENYCPHCGRVITEEEKKHESK